MYPRSAIMDMMPSVSADAFRAAYNSLSAELTEVNVCVLLRPFNVCAPTVMQPPVVDFLVRLQPAQSASLYVLMILWG